MTGYEIYCYCRRLQKWNIPSLDTYLSSAEFGYYEMLSNWSIKTKNFSSEEMKNYITVVYNYERTTFDPYKLMSEMWDEIYIKWKKTKSSKPIYLNTVKDSINFITNFCIKKDITLDKYKKDWAAKHIREQIIDNAVAVYLKLIDKKTLSPIQKLLLKNYFTEYNIIVVRIRDPELNKLLAELTEEMKRILDTCVSKSSLTSKQQ